ncbi:MAG: hypothetical protein HOO95_06340 [Gallionella sp.]|nr:hypothetical protein [Gallionella sp.]
MQAKTIGYSLVFLVINIVAGYLNTDSFAAVLGWLRLIEYFAVGFAMAELVISYKRIDVIKIIITINLAVAMMQFGLLLPNIDPGRGLIYSTEFSGLYGTPAELSYGLISLAFLLMLIEKKSNFRFIMPILLLNGVKAAALSLASLYQLDFFKKHLLLMFFVAITFSLMVFGAPFLKFLTVIQQTDFSGYRLADLKSYFDSESLPTEYLSLAHRVGKWGIALHLFFQDPFTVLTGYGLYAAGGALDGGILRFIFEAGLIGLVFAAVFLKRMKAEFLLLFVSCNVLFDAYLSSVVMPIHIAIIICLSIERVAPRFLYNHQQTKITQQGELKC